MDFNNKTIIITGGTRGIGKAICENIAKLGGNVIATGTNVNDEEQNGIHYIKMNLLDENSVSSFISYIQSLEKIDVLINNAGINIIEPIDNLSIENWNQVIQVNLTGPMRMIGAVAEKMKKQTEGRILNISSIWGVIGKEKRNSYAAAKAGLIGLTKTTALDLAKYNILVNALCPGFTMTEMTEKSLSEEETKKLSSEVPLGRFAEVSEMADLATFLCSELNTYITGQAIIADGGFTIR